MSSTTKATLLVAVAYLWWGFSPIFWSELGSVAPVDQLAWRVSLGLVYLALVWVWRRANPLAKLTSRHVRFGLFAAVMIAVNWGAFLWAVDNGYTVESALGYFFVPLLSVAVGVRVLGERLLPLQKIALVFGAIGLLWTIVAVGAFPWIAVVIGLSFTAYGWARKEGPWGAVDGLTFEMVVIAPAFIALLMFRGAGSSVDIVGDGSVTTLILISLAGVVTVVPLLLFATAAKKVPLTVIGLMQYINPTMQFLIGWQLFDEDVSTGRLLGLGWIWMALALVIGNEFRSQGPIDGIATRSDEGVVRS